MSLGQIVQKNFVFIKIFIHFSCIRWARGETDDALWGHFTTEKIFFDQKKCHPPLIGGTCTLHPL